MPKRTNETGLDHFEARDYDSRLGRWLNPDPSGQFWSPYLAMGNIPVSGIDLDGRFSSELVAKFYNFLHGNKGEIVGSGKNWAVNFSMGESLEDGVMIVTSFKGLTWGKISSYVDKLNNNTDGYRGMSNLLWNTIGRFIVADKYSISVSSGATGGMGGRGGGSMHFITRGNDTGVHFTLNGELNFGWDITLVDVEVTKGYYLSFFPSNIKRESLNGLNIADTGGVTLATGNFSLVRKVSLHSNYLPSWYEHGFSIGFDPVGLDVRGTMGIGFSKVIK